MKKLRLMGRCMMFALILCMILYYLSLVFVPKNNLDQAGMRDVSANGILSEKDNSIDVLVIGDSEAYSSIIPMEMYHKYGFTSYVLATPGQPLYYTKTLLDRTLKSQTPRVIILETNAIYRDFQPFSPLIEEVRKLFPVFDYHDRWKSLRIEDFSMDIHYTYNNAMKGYHYSEDVQPVASLDGYMKTTDVSQEIPALNQLFLDMIVNTCHENDIQLILLSTPSPVNWTMGKHLRIEEYAKNNELTYIDLNLEGLPEAIDWRKDTRDAGDHLNYAGAQKVTRFLGDYLSQSYDLPDHREDKGYVTWQESYQLYSQMIESGQKKKSKQNESS